MREKEKKTAGLKGAEFIKSTMLYTVIMMGALVMILPFAWMVVTSIKLPPEVYRFPPTWIPREPTLNNFIQVVAKAPFGRYFLNSTVVTSVTVVSSLFFSAMAGFAFAKYRFFGREVLFILILSTLMLPFHITMIPLYLLMSSFDWIDTYQGIMAPSLGTALGVFLMRQYIGTIPDELIDISRIDGCSEVRIFWEIILPLCKPALGTLAIILALGIWNDFLWPLIIVNTTNMRTLPLGIAMFKLEHYIKYGPCMAASVIVIAPLIILFLFIQKNLVKGLGVTTGLKE